MRYIWLGNTVQQNRIYAEVHVLRYLFLSYVNSAKTMTLYSPVFLTAQWRNLVLLNFEVPKGILVDLLPKGTELDLWENKCLVSLVGFQFLRTKVKGCALPGYQNFDEVNLRFYVKRTTAKEIRRGVVFVKEIANKRLVTWIARATYDENYVTAPMKHTVNVKQNEDRVAAEYAWKWQRRWNRIGVQASGKPLVPEEHSEQHFITEHYWGYTQRKDGGTSEYHVSHPSWRLWNAEKTTCDIDIEAVYGQRWVPFLAGPPCSAWLAEGSAVQVHHGVRISS